MLTSGQTLTVSQRTNRNSLFSCVLDAGYDNIVQKVAV